MGKKTEEKKNRQFHIGSRWSLKDEKKEENPLANMKPLRLQEKLSGVNIVSYPRDPTPV